MGQQIEERLPIDLEREALLDDASLPAEATDPALCGKYEPMQMAAVPDGAADTGGGSTAISGTGSQTGIAIGAAGLLAVAGAATISARRRRSEQD